MVLPPDRDDGLGIMLLNSNADAHFSFTNALGLMPADQVARIRHAPARQYPTRVLARRAASPSGGISAPAKALSERIGTALVNGNWFVRRLRPLPTASC